MEYPNRQPSGQQILRPMGRPLGQPTGYLTGLLIQHLTGDPSAYPTSHPSPQSTGQSTRHPTGQLTEQPVGQPKGYPTGQPVSEPRLQPSRHPARSASVLPSEESSGQFTGTPTFQPTGLYTQSSSTSTTTQLLFQPTRQPTLQLKTHTPLLLPTGQPTDQPTSRPTTQPFIEIIVAYPKKGKPTNEKPIPRNKAIYTASPTFKSQKAIYPTYPPSVIPSFYPSPQPTMFDGAICVISSITTVLDVTAIEGFDTISIAIAALLNVSKDSVACGHYNDLCQPSKLTSQKKYQTSKYYNKRFTTISLLRRLSFFLSPPASKLFTSSLSGMSGLSLSLSNTDKESIVANLIGSALSFSIMQPASGKNALKLF